MSRDVEVDSDTVYDWHTMLHLQLYFQGHSGKSSVPGMTSLLHCRCSWSVIMASCLLVVNPARASSQVGPDWRSHIVFEVTLAWQGAVAVKQ